MRQNSNFKGTEQELQIAMRKYLPKFTSNAAWLDDINKEVNIEEFINICESIAECVDNGYINDTVYTVLMNKTIAFRNKTVYAGKMPEDSIKPFTLSDKGSKFLES